VSQPVKIKRYANRRLYDTRASGYITLDDLSKLIDDGTDVVVVDAKSGDDLTRRVLLQVLLLDDQARKLDCLPVEFLHTLIRLRDHSMLRLFEQYIGMTLNSFTAAQQAMRRNLELLERMAPDPGELLASVMPWLRRGGGD